MSENDTKAPPREKGGSLCPECGHAFETYVDRLIGSGSTLKATVECPVCGCGDCAVGRE